MIVFSNVSKHYNDVVGLNTTSFQVETGELFGLIGPDGAGKSTVMRLLATLLLPDTGSITFNGINVVTDYKSVRKSIGYMPGSFALYTDLTVKENLEFFASVFSSSVEENYHLIKDIYDQLAPFRHRRAGALSGGMKQKLALSCALIHSPLALILDEPTTGVDAVSRVEFWNMLRRLKDTGMTILVSTPYLEEASLCDRVGLMNNGTFMRIGTPDEVVKAYNKTLWAIEGGYSHAVLKALRRYEAVHAVYVYRDKVMMSTEANISAEDIMEYLKSKEIEGASVVRATPDFEDCFMDLMQSHTSVKHDRTDKHG
ncbi:MAG: ABC transporter ATP-binding protein [Ignavibacteria bacterium]|nr:ABC transporter ATP-binding protein [Ignavibacteria bacterium]